MWRFRVRSRWNAIAVVAVVVLDAFLMLTGMASGTECVVYTAYMAVLCCFGTALVQPAAQCDRWVPAECVYSILLIGMFGGVMLLSPSVPDSLLRLVLLVSPAVTIGRIFDISIFRTILYGVSPLGGYYLILPAWWHSAGVFAVLSVIVWGSYRFVPRSVRLELAQAQGYSDDGC